MDNDIGVMQSGKLKFLFLSDLGSQDQECSRLSPRLQNISIGQGGSKEGNSKAQQVREGVDRGVVQSRKLQLFSVCVFGLESGSDSGR